MALQELYSGARLFVFSLHSNNKKIHAEDVQKIDIFTKFMKFHLNFDELQCKYSPSVLSIYTLDL